MTDTPSSSPVIQSREIRVFLSSTFKDMEAERNHLLTQVFPALRQICNDRQVAFTEIDLRWGVTEEASKNGRTVEICLDEIDRCRQYPPFFIGFLGERYGWVPTHADLEHYWATRGDSPYAQTIRAALDKGISVTELELRYGFLQNPAATDNARIFLRAAELTDTLYAQSGSPLLTDFYDKGNDKLDALKQSLRASNHMALDNYETVDVFGEAVRNYLEAMLDKLFPVEQMLSAADRSSRSHAIYAQSRRKSYVPLPVLREQVLTFLDNALNEQGNPRLRIAGASGLGKSAFLADLETWLPQQRQAWLFTHYTGADGDRSLDGWCDRLIDALEKTGKLTTPVSAEQKARWEALPIALFEAHRGLNQPLVLLLDAINQINDPEAISKLSTLLLPAQVVLITTSTPEIITPAWQSLALIALDETQRRCAVTAFMDVYRKELAPALIVQLVNHPACAVPLFLRLVLEELRLHAKHETLGDVLQTLLATGDAGALFQHVLQAMDKDFSEPRHIDLASRAARLLAASWRGLRHNDLAGLLAYVGDPLEPVFGNPRLPDHIVGSLLARLEPFCLRDNGRIFLMHQIIIDAILPSIDIQTREKITAAMRITIDKESYTHGHAEILYQYGMEDEIGFPKLVDRIGDMSIVTTVFKEDKNLLNMIFDYLLDENYEGRPLEAPSPKSIAVKIDALWRKNRTTLKHDNSWIFEDVCKVACLANFLCDSLAFKPDMIEAWTEIYVEIDENNLDNELLIKLISCSDKILSHRFDFDSEYPITCYALKNLLVKTFKTIEDTQYINNYEHELVTRFARRVVWLYEDIFDNRFGRGSVDFEDLANLKKALRQENIKSEPYILEATRIRLQYFPNEGNSIGICICELANNCEETKSKSSVQYLIEIMENFEKFYMANKEFENEPLLNKILETRNRSLLNGQMDISQLIRELVSINNAIWSEINIQKT